MSNHYPRIRIYSESGYLLIREGLSLTFYMRRPHEEVAPAVLRAFDSYRRNIGPSALGRYTDQEGHWHDLDDEGWALTRRELSSNSQLIFDLADASGSENRYRFRYYGRPADKPSLFIPPEAVSAVSFWLPTEYLEENGPGRVRDLALELAGALPFDSGHAGLSFNCETDLAGVRREVRQSCFRFPGMDIPDPHLFSSEIGLKLRGVAWLTFLGQPVLGELGGAAGLRSRIRARETTVQELEGDRAVVTLGPWPEAGDTEQGQVLPAYRELAHLLEPWLHHQEALGGPDFTPEDTLRWERRFLD
jgi:hypothetical protein